MTMLPNATLHSLLTGLTGALEAQVRPDTGLFDPLDDRPSPADHYGHVCAALALACAGKHHWDSGRLALQAWLGLPAERLGHLPFNRLALLLLREVLGAEGLVAADARLIDTGLRRCTLRHRYPSNNWSLLAQTCRLIEAPAHKKAHESRRLCALFERWTTPKGCFIDFPENPGKHFSTPLAYHHKALFLAALACWFHEDAALANHARRLCDWLVHCWDPAGYAGGFGRSTHSLFGDGCLIAGLILLGIDKTDSQPITALAQRIAQQRRSDGLLWLNPAGHESGKASWDSYMHLSVYNAWAAAVIGASMHLRGRRSPPPVGCRWAASQTGWFHDEAAGLGCLRDPSGLTALISTRGQPPQAYSRDEADFRYSGGVVAHLHLADRGPLIAPPIRTGRASLAQRPELAGWTPLLSSGNELFALSAFNLVSIQRETQRIQITLEGQPVAVFRPAPSSAWQRLKSAVDWRCLNGRLGRKSALHRRTHPGIRGTLQLCITTAAASPSLQVKLTLSNTSGAEVRYMDPQGRAWVTADQPANAEGASPRPYFSSIPGARASCRLPEPLPPGTSEWTWPALDEHTPQRELAISNDAP